MTYKEAVEEVAYEFEVGMGCKLGDVSNRGNQYKIEIKDANGFPPADFEDMAYDGLEYLLGEEKTNSTFVSVVWDVLSGEVQSVNIDFQSSLRR